MIDKVENLGIVVPVHDALACVSNLLNNLENSEATDLPIIFVNDASTEDVRTPILEYCSKHRNSQYLYNPVQQLFTRTINRGIRAHTPFIDFFVLLNTDCELKPGWLNEMIEVMQMDVAIACVGYPDGVPQDLPYNTDAYYPSRHGSPDYITGSCMLIPRWAFKEVGLFWENAPLLESPGLDSSHIGSERLFCWELSRAGYRMVYINKPLCIHNSGGPSWKRDIGWLYRFPKEQLWTAVEDAKW